MAPRKNNQETERRHEHPLPQEISKKQKAENHRAFEEASHDIDEDPDLSIHSPNDDLDEEEAAKLKEDNTDLV